MWYTRAYCSTTKKERTMSKARNWLVMPLLALAALLGAGIVATPAHASGPAKAIICCRPFNAPAGRYDSVPTGGTSTTTTPTVDSVPTGIHPLSTFGTYANCMNYASYYAIVGVYWETSGSNVRPYQVWFNKAAAGIYSMNVKHYTANVQRESHTFPQGGQKTQVHNWTGLAWGARNTTQWVDFRLTLSDGSACTGRVYPVTT